MAVAVVTATQRGQLRVSHWIGHHEARPVHTLPRCLDEASLREDIVSAATPWRCSAGGW